MAKRKKKSEFWFLDEVSKVVAKLRKGKSILNKGEIAQDVKRKGKKFISTGRMRVLLEYTDPGRKT